MQSFLFLLYIDWYDDELIFWQSELISFKIKREKSTNLNIWRYDVIYFAH